MQPPRRTCTWSQTLGDTGTSRTYQLSWGGTTTLLDAGLDDEGGWGLVKANVKILAALASEGSQRWGKGVLHVRRDRLTVGYLSIDNPQDQAVLEDLQQRLMAGETTSVDTWVNRYDPERDALILVDDGAGSPCSFYTLNNTVALLRMESKEPIN